MNMVNLRLGILGIILSQAIGGIVGIGERVSKSLRLRVGGRKINRA